MTNTRTLSLFLEIGRLIRARMAHALPVPFAQCEALRLVHQTDAVRMRDIADHLHVTAPSATALVGELVAHGYLTREARADDRREVVLSLTPKGVRALREIDTRRTAVVAELLAPLGDEDHAELDRILQKIITTHLQ